MLLRSCLFFRLIINNLETQFSHFDQLHYTSLRQLIKLRSRHESHFMSPLNYFRAPSLAQQFAVLEKPFVSWKSVETVVESC